MRLKMLPQSALKEVKVFQVLCLLDFFGEGEFSCFSGVPISFLANGLTTLTSRKTHLS